jgi:ribosomal protein S6E (S10)
VGGVRIEDEADGVKIGDEVESDVAGGNHNTGAVGAQWECG